MLEQGRIGAPLPEQLSVMRDFVNDEIIYEVQRVYDHADLMAENIAQQRDRSTTTHSHESPRRLFDLIASLNAAMTADAPDDKRSLASLWRTVLRLDVDERDHYTVYELRDKGGRAGKPPYFSIESHLGEDSERLFVMRWSGGLDAASVLAAIGASFKRHEETRLELVVGTSTEVLAFDVELPVELEEIVHAVGDADQVRGSHGNVSGEDDRTRFRWVRFNGKAFDIYADVAAELPHDPVVGVFAPALHAEHVTDLYQRSSARYLFGAWLNPALSHIAGIVSDAATRTDGGE